MDTSQIGKPDIYQSLDFTLTTFIHPKLQFLYFYSKLLVQNNQTLLKIQAVEKLSIATIETKISIQIQPLFTEFTVYTLENPSTDPFMLYLHALFLSKQPFTQSLNEEINNILCQSVNTYPFFWASWVLLAKFTKTKQQVHFKILF